MQWLRNAPTAEAFTKRCERNIAAVGAARNTIMGSGNSLRVSTLRKRNSRMKKVMLGCCFAMAVSVCAAQTPSVNSVTLEWTNPSTYASGQPLTLGQVTVFVDMTASATSISGSPTTFTTTVLAAGTHTFNVVACDNQTPMNCSPMSNPVTVVIPPGGPPLVIPAVPNLSAKVN